MPFVSKYLKQSPQCYMHLVTRALEFSVRTYYIREQQFCEELLPYCPARSQ